MFQARSHHRSPAPSHPVRRRFAPRRTTRLLAALAVATGALLASGAPAHALLVEDAPDCTSQPTSKPFTPWLDFANYVQVPGGTFESDNHGWHLSGGATVGEGNEPWNVAADDGSHSLNLPPGSRAVTPTMCVGVEHPTLRFFADRDGGLPLSSVLVGVRVRTSLGLVVELPLGVVTSSGNWSPTAPYVVVANLLPLLPGNHTPVEFTFTSLGSSTWQIDDVYVDPWGKG